MERFANTVSRASTIFVDKKYIISKISVSLPSFPFFIVLSESITFAITILLYFFFLLFTGAPLSKVLFFLPFIYFVQQVFAYALGFFIATFHVFIKDLKEVTGIVLQVWFWFTPIVYVQDIVPDYAKKMMLYNPAFLFVKAYQDIFVYQQVPDLNSLILLVFIGHSLLLITYLLFKKLEKDVRDFI